MVVIRLPYLGCLLSHPGPFLRLQLVNTSSHGPSHCPMPTLSGRLVEASHDSLQSAASDSITVWSFPAVFPSGGLGRRRFPWRGGREGGGGRLCGNYGMPCVAHYQWSSGNMSLLPHSYVSNFICASAFYDPLSSLHRWSDVLVCGKLCSCYPFYGTV